MIKRTIVDIEINITTDELVKEIKLLGPLDLVWVLRAIIETLTGKMLTELRDFLGTKVSEIVGFTTLVLYRPRRRKSSSRVCLDKLAENIKGISPGE